MDKNEIKEYFYNKLIPFDKPNNTVDFTFQNIKNDELMGNKEIEYRYIISLVCDMLDEYDNLKKEK